MLRRIYGRGLERVLAHYSTQNFRQGGGRCDMLAESISCSCAVERQEEPVLLIVLVLLVILLVLVFLVLVFSQVGTLGREQHGH